MMPSFPFAPQWEPVQYFNNKIICDLVEEKFKGIISILVSPLLLQGLMLEAGWEAVTPFPILLGVSTEGPSLVLSRDRAGLCVEGEVRCWPGLEAVCGRLPMICPVPCVCASWHSAPESPVLSSSFPDTSLTLCHTPQDEECLRPGEATDLTFLEKLEDTIKHHPHFLT